MTQSHYSREEIDRYEDCDRCGERYWGVDRDRYLRDVTRGRSELRICCDKDNR